MVVTGRNLLILFFLGAMFGASFLYMRVAAPVMGPWVVAFVRVGFAALLLTVVARRTGLRAIARDWRSYLFLGAVNAALPFGMFAFAETTLTASMGAILNAMAPMAMAIASAAWLAQPLTGRKLAGIGLGVLGVTTIVGLGHIDLDGQHLVAMAACLLAVSGYAVGFTFAKRRMPHVDPVTISLGQAVMAAVILAPGAVLTLPAAVPGLEVALAMLALATFSTALAWPLMFRLVGAIGPTASSTVTFLAPAFGIGWGALILGEPIGPSLLIGAVLVLLSVALIVGIRPPTARFRRFVDSLWTTAPRMASNPESRG
jgi:drug/metabolite transporter (DMT)-like permease